MSEPFKPVPLTPAEIAELDQDIEDTFERLTEDLRQLRGE